MSDSNADVFSSGATNEEILLAIQRMGDNFAASLVEVQHRVDELSEQVHHKPPRAEPQEGAKKPTDARHPRAAKAKTQSQSKPRGGSESRVLQSQKKRSPVMTQMMAGPLEGSCGSEGSLRSPFQPSRTLTRKTPQRFRRARTSC